jgi:hypothetical protein
MSDLDHVDRDVVERDVIDAGGVESHDAVGDLGLEVGLVAPAKAVRLLSTLKATLDELHRAPIDETTRRSMIATHQAALIEVASTVSDVLIDELVRLHIAPLSDDATAAQIRVAQAQLLGWVVGLIQSGGAVDAPSLQSAPSETPPGPRGPTPERARADVGAPHATRTHR